MKAFQGAKAKIVRRFGVNIFETDKYDRILGRRKFPPGMHGPTKRIGKISEYGKQLIEKQKMKFMYGMTEKQFRNFYEKAERKKGATGINLLQMLETRLDNFTDSFSGSVHTRWKFATTKNTIIFIRFKNIDPESTNYFGFCSLKCFHKILKLVIVMQMLLY